MGPTGMIFRDGHLLWSELRCAQGFWERLQGLLGRPALSENQGLLLTACASVHTIGMTYPIDIIFLNQRMRVLACHSKVSPWRMRMCPGSSMTLELAAGSVHRHAVLPGQGLEWRNRAA